MKKAINLKRRYLVVTLVLMSFLVSGVALAASAITVRNSSFTSDISQWGPSDPEQTGCSNGGAHDVANGNPTGSGPGSALVTIQGVDTCVELVQCIQITSNPTNPYAGVNAWVNISSGTNAWVDFYAFSDPTCTTLTADENNSATSNFISGAGWQLASTEQSHQAIKLPSVGGSVQIVLHLEGATGNQARFDDVATYQAISPNAVTLNSLDARSATEPSPLWWALIALPIALGALLLRRRRA